MASDPTLRRLRQLRRDQRAQSESDLRYTIYVALMVLLIVGVPVIRMAILGLASPEIVAFVVSTAAPAVLSAVTGLLIAALVVLGRIRGPALVDPFRSAVVASNHLPRRQTLLRPFLVSTTQLVGVLVALALVLSAALAVAGAASALSVVVFVAATVLVGILAGIAWLGGQSLPPRSSQRIAAALAAVSLTGAVIPGGLLLTPWGWVALLYPSSGLAPWLALAGLAIAVLAASLVVPKLLDGIRGSELNAQAQRWTSAATFTASADLAGAFEQFRALPTVGRQWRAVQVVPTPILMFVRDIVGSLRTPERALLAALSLTVAGFLLASISAVPATVAWAPALLGGVIAFLALGVWSDGFRHAADTAVALPLYGFGVAKEIALHATLPVVGVLVFVGAGALTALAVGASPASVIVALAFALFIVIIRIMNATKGQMPLELLAPIPTPAGDLSGALVMMWQADALLLTSVLSLALTTSWLSTPVLLTLIPVAAVIVLAIARHNLANAR
ncbi:hypothetical protein I6E74_10400 [Salinibacterium sp. SWN139]|uniref:hypothetical protein n=1 Tax=Salinibacterium sp. SWN139 TaxID=2792055 RepID=UPI0018CE4374|nr:hypothetical protein [Salinibacterium sp. SWN139]MBH0054574.1 hypothetical protein [Salinibacterium sp. SWN139]